MTFDMYLKLLLCIGCTGLLIVLGILGVLFVSELIFEFIDERKKGDDSDECGSE